MSEGGSYLINEKGERVLVFRTAPPELPRQGKSIADDNKNVYTDPGILKPITPAGIHGKAKSQKGNSRKD